MGLDKLFSKIVAFVFLFLLVPTLSAMAATVQWSSPTEPVSTTKDWSVRFNQSVFADSINANNVYVVDAVGNLVNTVATVSSSDDRIVVVASPTGGYEHGKTYTLHISQAVSTKQNKQLLKDAVEMQFTIAADPTPLPDPTPSTDYTQYVLGGWTLNYGAYQNIPVTFKSDMKTEVMGMVGDYSISGSEMSVSILGRQVSGTITKISDREFTITNASGSVAKFTR